MNKLIQLTIVLGYFVIANIRNGNVSAAMPKSANNELNKLKEQFLPPEFLQAANNYSSADAKKILIEKCKKVSGPKAAAAVVNEIEKGSATFAACISALGNVTEIQNEIDVARPIGEIDTVFGKYCNKRLEAEKCIRKFNEKIQPCLTAEEKEQNVVTIRVITRVLEFACFKGGDNLALFIAEEGPECLEDHRENIINCMNSSFSGYVPKNAFIPEMIQLPKFIIGPKQCYDFIDFEQCVVGHMETCDDMTPANIIQSIFKYIKTETNCTAKPLDRKQRNRNRNRNHSCTLPTIGLSFIMSIVILTKMLNILSMN